METRGWLSGMGAEGDGHGRTRPWRQLLPPAGYRLARPERAGGAWGLLRTLAWLGAPCSHAAPARRPPGWANQAPRSTCRCLSALALHPLADPAPIDPSALIGTHQHPSTPIHTHPPLHKYPPTHPGELARRLCRTPTLTLTPAPARTRTHTLTPTLTLTHPPWGTRAPPQSQ